MPFSLHPKPCTEKSAFIPAFAWAPKLPKNAHKLDGLLAGYTTEVPDTHRTQDFQARQLLHDLIMNHELFKFQEQIAHQALPICRDPSIKDISHVIGNGNLPLVQTLISNQLLIAKQINLQLRTKVASSVRTHSSGLFVQTAIAKAEDCPKHTPQTVVVQQPSFCPQPLRNKLLPLTAGMALPDLHFPATEVKEHRTNDVLPHSTSPPARANFQVVRTKTSPTGVKVANKPPAPNSRVPQAASTNNDIPISLQLRHASRMT